MNEKNTGPEQKSYQKDAKEKHPSFFGRIWRKIRNRMTGNEESAQPKNPENSPTLEESRKLQTPEDYYKKNRLPVYGMVPEQLRQEAVVELFNRFLKFTLEDTGENNFPNSPTIALNREKSTITYATLTELANAQLSLEFNKIDLLRTEREVKSVRGTFIDLYTAIDTINQDPDIQKLLLEQVQSYVAEVKRELIALPDIQSLNGYGKKEYSKSNQPEQTLNDLNRIRGMILYPKSGDEIDNAKAAMLSELASDPKFSSILDSLRDLFDVYKAHREKTLQEWQSFQDQIVPTFTRNMRVAKTPAELDELSRLATDILDAESQNRDVAQPVETLDFLRKYKQILAQKLRLFSRHIDLEQFNENVDNILEPNTRTDGAAPYRPTNSPAKERYRSLLVSLRNDILSTYDLANYQQNLEQAKAQGVALIENLMQGNNTKQGAQPEIDAALKVNKLIETLPQDLQGKKVESYLRSLSAMRIRGNEKLADRTGRDLIEGEAFIKESIAVLDASDSLSDVDTMIRVVISSAKNWATVLLREQDAGLLQNAERSAWSSLESIDLTWVSQPNAAEKLELLTLVPEIVRVPLLLAIIKKKSISTGFYAETTVEAGQNMQTILQIVRQGLLFIQSPKLHEQVRLFSYRTLRDMELKYRSQNMFDERLPVSTEERKAITEQKEQLYVEFAYDTILSILEAPNYSAVKALVALAEEQSKSKYFNTNEYRRGEKVEHWTILIKVFAAFYIDKILRLYPNGQSRDSLGLDKEIPRLADSGIVDALSLLINKIKDPRAFELVNRFVDYICNGGTFTRNLLKIEKPSFVESIPYAQTILLREFIGRQNGLKNMILGFMETETQVTFERNNGFSGSPYDDLMKYVRESVDRLNVLSQSSERSVVPKELKDKIKNSFESFCREQVGFLRSNNNISYDQENRLKNGIRALFTTNT